MISMQVSLFLNQTRPIISWIHVYCWHQYQKGVDKTVLQICPEHYVCNRVLLLSPENSKFIYEPGKTYDYQYESDLKTWMKEGTEEQSSLHMRATAQVEVLSRCEMVLKVEIMQLFYCVGLSTSPIPMLWFSKKKNWCVPFWQLSDVNLQDSNPQQYDSRQYVERAWEFTRALQEKPLRFAFLDGQIESICPDEEESWVLNLKRGILSALQNTMTSLEESIVTREVCYYKSSSLSSFKKPESPTCSL